MTQFAPPGLKDEAAQLEDPATVPRLVGELRASNLTLQGEGGEHLLDGVSFRIDLPSHIAIIGPAGSGKEELTLVLAGLVDPTGGRVTVGEVDLSNQPEAVLGRRIGYVGNPTMLFAGSLEDNLLYGLKYRPQRPRQIGDDALSRYEREMTEARQSGNSPHDPGADWIDYAAAGIDDPATRVTSIVRVLELVRLDGDVFALGLRSAIPDGAHLELKERLLEARRAMLERLGTSPDLSRLIEPFDPERYNTNASLAENLLFGSPVGPTFDPEQIADQPYVGKTLERTGLLQDLYQVGYRLAQTMLELFADLPPEHEYFSQFSFIAPEDLPTYRNLLTRADPARLDRLSAEDRRLLLAPTFKLIPARHRLGLITPELMEKVLVARRYFRENLPERYQDAIAFFDPDAYNIAITIQENVIFGKIAYGQAQAPQRIADLLTELLDKLELRTGVMAVGLDYPVGIGGGRLSLAQRQKAGLARAVVKQPDILVLYDPLGPLDQREQIEVRDALLAATEGRTVIWALQHDEWATAFDHVIELDEGRLVREGPVRGGGTNDQAHAKLVTAE